MSTESKKRRKKFTHTRAHTRTHTRTHTHIDVIAWLSGLHAPFILINSDVSSDDELSMSNWDFSLLKWIISLWLNIWNGAKVVYVGAAIVVLKCLLLQAKVAFIAHCVVYYHMPGHIYRADLEGVQGVRPTSLKFEKCPFYLGFLGVFFTNFLFFIMIWCPFCLGTPLIRKAGSTTDNTGSSITSQSSVLQLHYDNLPWSKHPAKVNFGQLL